MDFSASGKTWYGREERQRGLDSGSTRAREGRVESQRGAAMLESSASRGMKPREQKAHKSKSGNQLAGRQPGYWKARQGSRGRQTPGS